MPRQKSRQADGTNRTTIVVSFTLDSQEDRHIIRWLDSLGRGDKSAAIRDALEAHVKGGGVSNEDIYSLLKQIQRQIGQGGGAGYILVPAGAGGAPSAQDDPELAKALGDLRGLGL